MAILWATIAGLARGESGYYALNWIYFPETVRSREGLISY